MLYPENIEKKLGFDEIRECLRKECLSPLGLWYVERIRFSDDPAMINQMLDQTAEFMQLLSRGLNFPSQNYIDVIPLLNKIKPEGSFLEKEELRDVKVSFLTIFSCLEFFEKNEGFPKLYVLAENVKIDKALWKELEKIISDKGEVKDDASPDLKEIRRSVLSSQSNLRKELESILRNAIRQGYSEPDAALTIRNGRMVIPVSSDHKRKVKGFIHDESATGQTVFIEPSEVFEINNEIRELELKERREVINILVHASDMLRENMTELVKSYKFLGLMDFIRAKARFSISIDAVRPELVDLPYIKWIQAKHPLLLLNLRKQNKNVVPLSIELDQYKRVLIISGPNAGGKSVSLKTVGLLQYMLQTGLPVPVREGSVAGIFQNIFIDIGDEQSLENDLSTYSSHLKNMKHFISYANRKTLILIDEFGTGTEPQLGGAIAEAVLEKLNAEKTFAVITTHYANLKAFGDKGEGVINGATRFDAEKLEPLYELEIGKPGSSFAFEIARKIGLPEEVLQESRNKIGQKHFDLDKMLAELETEKKKIKDTIRKISEKEHELEKTLKEYEEKREFIEENRKRLLNEAKQKAKELLNEANQKIEKAIREIKEKQAGKEITREIRRDLEEFSKSLVPEEEKRKTELETESGAISIGDAVRVKDSGALGEVLSVKEKDAEILIGELKSNIKLNRLEKISRKKYRELTEKKYSYENVPGFGLSKKQSSFYPQIDVRGKRGEEALREVEDLLDSALIFRVSEVKIVHGKGDGILRGLILDYLKNFPYVKSVSDEHADRGGAGVTVVLLDV
jgi:DNA mismatch repair protein MutS2